MTIQRFFIQQGRLLMVTAAVAVLIAVGVVAVLPQSYDVSFSISVARQPQEAPAGAYTYEGYYAVQAAETVTDTVKEWLGTPEVVVAVLEDADLPTEDQRLRDLESRFFVRKRGAQYVEARTTVRETDAAAPLVAAVREVLQRRLERLGLAAPDGPFVITVSDPVVADARPPMDLAALITAVLAVVVVAFWRLINVEEQ